MEDCFDSHDHDILVFECQYRDRDPFELVHVYKMPEEMGKFEFSEILSSTEKMLQDNLEIYKVEDINQLDKQLLENINKYFKQILKQVPIKELHYQCLGFGVEHCWEQIWDDSETALGPNLEQTSTS